ncbi:hypothetical protein [Mycobacterium sp.]|uniref:hypothetical protein n=1 Tax=Mycobacterium sp. TaxID=1785 RepID=UPI002605C49B|nr:hypothetical protein [Mycobacterium sp.]
MATKSPSTAKPTAAKRTAAKRSTAKPNGRAAAKPNGKTTAKPVPTKRQPGTSTAPTKPQQRERTADQLAAAAATECLRHGGAYTNASGVSAKQLADMRQTLKLAKLDAATVLGGGKPLAKPAAHKLACGTTKPTAAQTAAWHDVTKRYAKHAFGVTGATTKNKLTGRKIACVLYAIAHGAK